MVSNESVTAPLYIVTGEISGEKGGGVGGEVVKKSQCLKATPCPRTTYQRTGKRQVGGEGGICYGNCVWKATRTEAGGTEHCLPKLIVYE